MADCTPNPTGEMGIEETAKGICDSLLRVPELVEHHDNTEGGIRDGFRDLLIAFRGISQTLEENASNRRENLRAAAAELSAADLLLEEADDESKAAYKSLAAVDEGNVSALDPLKKESEAPAATAAASAYRYTIYMAYRMAVLARQAAASAMDATISEVQAAAASRAAPADSKQTAKVSAADAKTAADMAKEAAKEARSLALQAAAESRDLGTKLKDPAPEGMVEVGGGTKELEGIAATAATIEATKKTMGTMLEKIEGKAADAEVGAKNALGAAAVVEATGECPSKEKTVQEFLKELDSLIHINDFLNKSLGRTTVRRKLPEEIRKLILELESSQLRKLAEFSRENSGKSPEELLEGSLEIMREMGQYRKDLVRQEILKLDDFQKLDELNKFLDPEDSEPGFLRDDLQLRRESLKKREAAYGKSDSPGGTVAASGETSSALDFLPTVNCRFNNKYLKAVLAPGAASNVVSEDWIKQNNLPQDAARMVSLNLPNGSVAEDCPCLLGPLMVKAKNGPSTYQEEVEFVMLKGFKQDALLGFPFLRLTQITHSSTGQLLFAEYQEIAEEEVIVSPIHIPTMEEMCNSLLDFSTLLDSESGEEGDLLSAFGKISETLKENAKNRKESLKAAAAGLSAAEELLEEAEDQSKAVHDLSVALGKAKDAVLDPLKKSYGAKPTKAASREADWAYQAICMAYSTARSASTAAASAMEATVSEVRATTTSLAAPAASKKATEASVADVNAAAGVAKAASKEATALAVQAAAESLGLLKKLRDSAPRGTREKIERGIQELEAIAAITEATTGAVGEIVSQAEAKAADAEKAARNAAAAAEAAEAVEAAEAAEAAGGTTEAPDGAVEGVAEASPPKEKIVQEILEELDSLVHINDFLKQSLGGTTVQQKLPEETRKSLSELDSLQRRQLAEFSQKNKDKSPKELLEGTLKIMRKIGQTRKNLVREQILTLSDFQKLDELNELLDYEDSEQGFLRNDLEIRRESLKKREAALEKPGKGPSRAGPAGTAAAPGETTSAMDSLRMVNCMFNNKYMRAMIDPGATYNIVSEAWIKRHKMPQDAKRYETLLSGDGSVTENCPCLSGSLVLKVKNGPSTYLKDVEFVMLKGFKGDALLGSPFLKLAQITHSSTGQLLFSEHEICSPAIEATSKDICDSLLDFPKLLGSESGEKVDLLSAFGKISETLKENANKRTESLKAAEAELSAAEELLKAADDQSSAAHELSEAVGKAKDAVNNLLIMQYETNPPRAGSQETGWARHEIFAAYSAARSASAAAASAMDATVSEVRAATASRVAPATSKEAASASAADVNAAAGVAKAAAKEASALAVRAAAESLGLLKNLRSLTPQEMIEEIESGIKELEAIAAITEATTGTMGEMESQAEGTSGGAEEAARNAARAAEEAGAAAEAAEGAVERAAGARPRKEKLVQEIMEEFGSLNHTNDFLEQTIGGTTIHQKLPEETQKSLSELESLQNRKLAEFSRENSDKSPEELLEGTLKIMRKIGQYRKDLVREQILKLSDFQKLDELNQLLDHEDSKRGFLRNDLELRRKNLKKRETVLESSEECLYCASPSETVTASSETGSTTDSRLKLNCIFNNKHMRALVDTGATCNVVSEDWIKKYNLPREAKRTESLLSANGSVTSDCPCLTGLWKLQDKGAPGTVWKDVEFVMLKGYGGDALLGMPFLKLTQIIHSSTGQILFPEYKEIPGKEGAPRPVFPNNTTESN